MQGQFAGKLEVVIVTPEYIRFRSRFKVKEYLDEKVSLEARYIRYS